MPIYYVFAIDDETFKITKFKIGEKITNIKMESMMKKKVTKADIEKYYDMATDTSGWDPEFDNIQKKVFGGYHVDADIRAYFDVVKKKPNGKQLFVDYIFVKRPKGIYYMTPEPTKIDKKWSGKNKMESMIEQIITSIRRNKI